MPPFDDLPVADDPDPIESDDPVTLRVEILRLRDGLLGADGRAEVLRDRVAELETREAELDAANAELQETLARNPLMRVIAAARRRIPGAGR